jgi:FkbM family methyltransferase
MLAELRTATLSKLHDAGLLDVLRAARLPKSVYKHLAFQGVIQIPLTAGARMRMNHYGYAIENELYWGGFSGGHEPTSQAIWLEAAGRSTYVVDVGANTGAYALAAAAIRPDAKILALEPIARTFARLQTNVALNAAAVTCLCMAASDNDGVAVMHDVASEHQYSASLNATMLGDRAQQRTEVQTARLDTLLPQLGFPRVDLIKLDVEMHEPEVVAGAMDHIVRDRPTLIVEILNEAIFRRLRDQLSAVDYAWYKIVEHGAPGDRASDDPHDRNYLLCRPDAGLDLARYPLQAI